ncbi:3-hydroxyacid dehydrogenase/reductase [Niveomyces insectorum RCEF 264]|uniref:3-hydroxyacid dehydrogenase/reductase n=1 Tax=Niveomyces insectorum RCEF 264 TaxID=1081102 RepID=A0A167VFP1_9HYPO|nr:3-hydroxyacid dehydrogenase/reductase [Niveomyces insectorum RCEF 264]
MAPKVFFVGLGNMGLGMCKNIVEKANLDQPLLVYNRTKERATAFAESVPAGKVTVVDSIDAGVAQADVVWTMLSNDQAVEDVYAQALGAAAAADPQALQKKLFIESSTIHPDTTGRVAAKVADHSATFVAAPVFGAPAMAQSGQLIGVLAGSGAAIDRARPYFKGVTSRAEVLMRDEPVGNALLLKVIGNTFILNMVEQLAEGHVLAEKTGLGTAALHGFVEQMFPGPYAAYSQRMLSGQYHAMERPLFGVDLALKDVGHALNVAASAGTRMLNAETGEQHLQQVKAHDGEKGDIAGIYGAVRQEAGLPFENTN